MSTTQSDPAIADVADGAIGGIYGLLARRFEEPDRDGFEALRSARIEDELQSLVDRAGLAVTVPSLVPESDYDLHCARFNDIFTVGYPEPPVPLYESAYHDEGRWEEINVDLARAYSYFDVSIDQDRREHHDHLVVELEFVGYLARLAAVRDDDRVRRARRDLLERHLLPFARNLADAIDDEVETGIFDAQVRFLRAVVEADLERLEARLDADGGEAA
ncbi:MAG: molecular chaperone TorD family protein [Halodesulfurarchaeum sp.]